MGTLEEECVMASSAYHRKQSLEQVLQQAKLDGFTIVKEQDSKTSCRIAVSHPDAAKKLTVNAFKKAEKAPGNLVSFLARTSKEVKQFKAVLAREAEKARRERREMERQAEDGEGFVFVQHVSPPPEEPEETEKSFKEQVDDACETLICWLDDQIKTKGLVQFTIQMLQPRERIGLPLGEEGSNVIRAALDHLVEKNILRRGKLPAPHSNRKLLAFRLNKFNGTTVMDVYLGKVAVPPPPRPDRKVLMYSLPAEPVEAVPVPAPAPKPAPAPAPAPKPAPKPQSDSFGAALVAEMADSEDQLIDLLIINGQYEKLVGVIVNRKDVESGVKVLKRVAELAAKGAMGGL